MSLKKEIEFRDGEIRIFDERAILFPPNIISLLGSIYGQGSKPILVFLGKKIGRFLVERWEEASSPKDLNDLVKLFFEMTSAAGWGTFQIEKISENEIIIKLSENIALAEDRPSPFICDFLTGYLTGFGEYALFSAKVTEIHCSILDKSQKSCEFKITKR